jgi:hypothetical protein
MERSTTAWPEKYTLPVSTPSLLIVTALVEVGAAIVLLVTPALAVELPLGARGISDPRASSPQVGERTAYLRGDVRRDPHGQWFAGRSLISVSATMYWFQAAMNEGARLRRSYQSARCLDGRLVVWAWHRKNVERGKDRAGSRSPE